VIEENNNLKAVDVPIAVVEKVDSDEEAPKDDDAVDVPIAVVEKVDSDEEAPKDDVRLWESGWKIRYYMTKFQVDVGDEMFRRQVVDAYIDGLYWVLRYYYQGVASWQWYYPFHYSPFASDFNLSKKKTVEFELGLPFRPIEQLMGIPFN
jgi:5'-3' exonuclease